MKTLKDIKPGQFLYTIYIDYNGNGDYAGMIVSQRMVKFIQENTKYNEIELCVERVRIFIFGVIATFSKDEEDHDHVKSKYSNNSDFIYCFSKEAFIRELFNISKNIKKTMASKKQSFNTKRYRHYFMPHLMKMLNTNKSEHVQILF